MKKTTFRYISPEKLSSVAIAGTFNSWNGDRDFLEEIEPGYWYISLEIPKGRHLYKFVLNDEAWILDPDNPSISEDGQNNSSITITEEGEALIRTLDISDENPGYMYRHFEAIHSPEWLQSSIIYQLHLRAFCRGGFQELSDKIAYLKSLGVNALWLMPFQPVGELRRIGRYGDPYAIKDYYAIDPEFGNEWDLKNLVDKLHENHIRVIMDIPVNRGSFDHILTKTNPEFFTRDKNGTIIYEVPNRDYFAGLNFANKNMRAYFIDALTYWVSKYNVDGFRLDDSDLAPHDFLADIKSSLKRVKDDIVLISQSYDEYHHIDSCDLTYEGGIRMAIKDMALGKISQKQFIQTYLSYKYSFPKNALRMRWLEEKEQPRAREYFGEKLVFPATAILLTLEGVPMLMMGEEFNEKTYKNWTSLFNEFYLDWNSFDEAMFEHTRFLCHFRTNNPAFWKGDIAFVETPGYPLLAFKRTFQNQSFLVAANLSDKPLTIPLPQLVPSSHKLKELPEKIASPYLQVSQSPGNDYSLAPFQTKICRLLPNDESFSYRH